MTCKAFNEDGHQSWATLRDIVVTSRAQRVFQSVPSAAAHYLLRYLVLEWHFQPLGLVPEVIFYSSSLTGSKRTAQFQLFLHQ